MTTRNSPNRVAKIILTHRFFSFKIHLAERPLVKPAALKPTIMKRTIPLMKSSGDAKRLILKYQPLAKKEVQKPTK